MTRPKLAVLFGPTAVGKSGAALQMAMEFDAEIVSADSMQVYRMLDIGTAKPSQEDRARVRHYLIDLVEPDQEFDAAKYVRHALAALADIHQKNKKALVVGGTGLYLRALMGGLFPCPDKDQSLRQQLMEEAEKMGGPALHSRLARVDPHSAARIQPRDRYRITRALEVYYLTGRPLSTHHQEHDFRNRAFQVGEIGLTLDRSLLYKRIERRTEEMFERGLVDEVRGLLNRGYHRGIKPFKSIIYRPVLNYLLGNSNSEDALPEIIRGTKRYAKRQMTWFKAEKGATWIDVGQPGWEKSLAQELAQFWEDKR